MKAALASAPKPPVPTVNFAQQSMATAVKAGPSAPRAALPPLKYSLAAMGASSAPAPTPTTSSTVPLTPGSADAVIPAHPPTPSPPPINLSKQQEQPSSATNETSFPPQSDQEEQVSPLQAIATSAAVSPEISSAVGRDQSAGSNVPADSPEAAASVASMSLDSPAGSFMEFRSGMIILVVYRV